MKEKTIEKCTTFEEAKKQIELILNKTTQFNQCVKDDELSVDNLRKEYENFFLEKTNNK